MLNSSVKQLVIEKNYMLMHKLSGIHISIEYDYGVELIQNYESWSASEFVEQWKLCDDQCHKLKTFYLFFRLFVFVCYRERLFFFVITYDLTVFLTEIPD